MLQVDISRFSNYLPTTPLVDLLHLDNPAPQVGGPATAGSIGLGDPFAMPFQTIESLLVKDRRTLIVANDNNFPFSSGRRPGLPDDNEIIQIRLPRALPTASTSTDPKGSGGPGGSGGTGIGTGYEVGLVGDMPYGGYGRALYPNVIADLNAHDLAFSIFDGDTKNGSESCFADPHTPAATATAETALSTAPYAGIAGFTQGQDVYKYALDLFAQYRRPVVYLPGDNEWTDCDRNTLTNRSDSVDRLDYLRRLSYPTAQSLGQSTLTLTRQSAAYPENVRWVQGPVTYVGLNVTGSDNNWIDPANAAKDGPAAQGQQEYTARNAANLAWLRTSFAAAKASGSRGVLIAMQADMWDPLATQKHFQDTKDELVRQVTAFAGPVVLVNGDSHSFQLDKPLTDAATTNAAGRPGSNIIQNFTRVTTFGDLQYHWVSMTVDPQDPALFTFHQHQVAADVPGYTTPTTP